MLSSFLGRTIITMCCAQERAEARVYGNGNGNDSYTLHCCENTHGNVRGRRSETVFRAAYAAAGDFKTIEDSCTRGDEACCRQAAAAFEARELRDSEAAAAAGFFLEDSGHCVSRVCARCCTASQKKCTNFEQLFPGSLEHAGI